MKNMIIGFLTMLVLFSGNTIQGQEAKEIAYKVYNRNAPKNGESDMAMVLINKKGGERVRNLHQYFIDLGEVEKQIMFFKSPADVKNTSFMNWSYEDATRSDDQWLYLPALKKVKRISNSSKDNDFMGSDFTYEDMEKRSPERDNHEFVRNETFNGEAVWVVQAMPKAEEQYSKKVAWISQEKSIPLKVEFYDEDEALLKTLTIEEVKQINGYWIVAKQVMKNIQNKHQTVIALSNIQVENGTTEGKFTQREMQRGL
jgi:outer membrane lipoprotein-sorting protein